MPATELRSVFRLDIQDDGREANSPVIIRLRIVLKRLLRQFGFRCTRVEQLKQAEESTTINQDGS